MTTRVTTELLKEVATSSTNDGTSLNSADSGKVVQLNAQGAIPSVYFNPIIDQWRLTSNLTGDAAPISSNLNRSAKLGGDTMSQSSGVFTFPKTGIYKVEAVFQAAATAGTGNCTVSIDVSTNADIETPTFAAAAQGLESGLPTVDFGNIFLSALVDVTSTSSVKVRFSVAQSNDGNALMGSSSANQTHFTFTRIGDT
tara:strand:+ start:13154 stop:13747 length:594 start_codon:yes stop_codon:yes gene_type:complete